MNELLDYYWKRYERLLFNTAVPDHLVESAYKVYHELYLIKYGLFR